MKSTKTVINVLKVILVTKVCKVTFGNNMLLISPPMFSVTNRALMDLAQVSLHGGERLDVPKGACIFSRDNGGVFQDSSTGIDCAPSLQGTRLLMLLVDTNGDLNVLF